MSWPLSVCKPLNGDSPVYFIHSFKVHIGVQVMIKWGGRSKQKPADHHGLWSSLKIFSIRKLIIFFFFRAETREVHCILALRGEVLWRLTQIYNRRCVLAIWLTPVICFKTKNYYKLSSFCMCLDLYRYYFPFPQQPFKLLDNYSHSTNVNTELASQPGVFRFKSWTLSTLLNAWEAFCLLFHYQLKC